MGSFQHKEQHLRKIMVKMDKTAPSLQKPVLKFSDSSEI